MMSDPDDAHEPPSRPAPADPLQPERRLAAAVVALAVRDARGTSEHAANARRFLMAPGHPARAFWCARLDVDAERLAERVARALDDSR